MVSELPEVERARRPTRTENTRPSGKLSNVNHPCIDPLSVLMLVPDEYSHFSPGLRMGMAPRAPGPLISSLLPFASTNTQCRVSSCTALLPLLVNSTLYVQP